MSGTVLSTLCSICHTEPPKYKCPRCLARTCSLPCIQKHKARADCDGLRNPRAFMPISQLKTAAGVDHDFNFLRSIERARERAEKDVVEGRQLLSEKELRPKNEDKVFHKVWYGDELHHVPAQSQPYKKHGQPQEGPAFSGLDKHLRRRLRYLDIEVVPMPKGLARQRENKTAWNRRTQSINWQVEWLVYGASDLGFPPQQDDQPLRVLHKTLEGTPLHAALASTLDWHRGQLDRQSRAQPDPAETDDEADLPNPKRRKTHHPSNKKKQPTPTTPTTTQDPSTSTWPAAPYPTQYPLTTAWSNTTTSPHVETTLEETLQTWHFYLRKAVKDDAQKTNKTLIPLASAETLGSVLAGRTVVEFPTIVAVPGGGEGCRVPAGYAVGSGEENRRRERKDGAGEEGTARTPRGEGGGGDGKNNNNNNKKRAFEGGFKGQGRGQPRQGMHGRGGKRVKFDAGRPTPAARVEHLQSEVEEGEVDSDGGDVVMGEVYGGRAIVGGVDWEASSITLGREEVASSVTMGREEEDGEIWEALGDGRPRGGLVDYGSSDESD